LAHCMVPVSFPAHRLVASGPVKPSGHVAGVDGFVTRHLALVAALPSGHVACVVGVPLHVMVVRSSGRKPTGHANNPSVHTFKKLPKQPG
jgi:hypothetical protein